MEIAIYALVVLAAAIAVMACAVLLLCVVILLRLREYRHVADSIMATVPAPAPAYTALSAAPVAPPAASPVKKSPVQTTPKRKSVKCPHCGKFTDLGEILREQVAETGAHFVHKCQRCGGEIQVTA